MGWLQATDPVGTWPSPICKLVQNVLQLCMERVKQRLVWVDQIPRRRYLEHLLEVVLEPTQVPNYVRAGSVAETSELWLICYGVKHHGIPQYSSHNSFIGHKLLVNQEANAR